MLPKIVVSAVSERDSLFIDLHILAKSVMSFEGKGAKTDDLRRWVYKSVEAAKQNNKLAIIIWEADLMSPDCQAVLLKPLEELEDNLKFFLIVENENRMLPTILSRCMVENLSIEKKRSETYWSRVRECWSAGPSACIALSDSLSKDEVDDFMMEIIDKLKTSLSTEVSQKRVQVLDIALTCLAELRQTHVNQKLSIDSFLINSWKLIKA